MSFLIGIIGAVLVARGLGPEGKGQYSLILLIGSYIFIFGRLGLPEAAVFFGSSGLRDAQEFTGAFLGLTLLLGAVLASVFLIIGPFIIESLLPGMNTAYTVIVSILVALFLPEEILGSLLLGQRKLWQFTGYKIAQGSLYALAIGTSLFWLRAEVLGAIIAYALSTLCGLLLLLYFHHKNQTMASPCFDRRLSGAIVRYGLKGYLGTILMVLTYRFDMFIVAYFLRASDVGLYSVAAQLGGILWLPCNSLGTIIVPQTAASTQVQANRFTPIVARNCLFGTSVVTLLTWVIGETLIVALFGDPFRSAAPALVALLPGVVAISLWNILANDLAGRGQPEYKSYGMAVAFVISIILDLILIPRFGIVGAAAASSIAYIINTLVIVYWFRRITGCHLRELLFPHLSDIALYRQAIEKIFAIRPFRIKDVIEPL